MPNTENKKDINFEFIFKLENYKNIENLNLKLNDYNVLLIEGENETGKTSLVTSIMEAHMGKSLTEEALTRGTEKGFVEHTIKDKNGNPVLVKQTLKKDGKSKFIAIDSKGNTISKVSEFEELLGKYFPISVQDFFNLAKTVPGRKEIVDKYLINLFSKVQRERLTFIDAHISEKVGVTYLKRRDINASIKALEDSIGTNVIPDEDLKLLENETVAKELLKKLQVELSTMDDSIRSLKQITSLRDDLKAYISKSIMLLPRDKKVLEPYYNDLEATLVQLQSYIDSFDKIDTISLKERIEKGQAVLDKITSVKAKVEVNTTSKTKLDTYIIERDKLQKEIDELKEEKKNIYSSSALPKGLSIEDDGFTIEGFNLSDTQLSFSKVGLIFAEIMMNIMNSNLLVMGNAGEYGTKRLNELCALAKKYNKTVLLTRVVDDLKDIRVVGCINNEIATTAQEEFDTKKKIKEEVKKVEAPIKPDEKDNLMF